MSGYPHNNQPGYGYGYGVGGPPGQPYGAAPYGGGAPDKPPKDAYSQAGPPGQPYGIAPYGGGAPSHKPDKPPKDAYSQAQPPYGYGASAPPYGAPSAPHKPPKDAYGYGAPMPYGGVSPFASLVPSAFPPGTDPGVVACFQVADQDGSGLIDDKELQRALSSFNQSFSLRTVHLLMYLFTNTNSRKIGPKEFISLYYSLQNWRSIFDRFDRDRSGKIDTSELREALMSMGYAVSPIVLDLLVLEFDKTGGKNKAVEYDNFIECCLTVKGLTDKFKAKDTAFCGSATFSYEEFMLTVLPFLVA